jgi:hypothetical protein
LLAVAVTPAWSLALAASPANSPGGPDLKVTLEKGLKARRPVEFEFVKLIVSKVDDGSIPRSMVNSTFLWARNNKQPYPFPSFQQALKVRAKKIGVDLPAYR